MKTLLCLLFIQIVLSPMAAAQFPGPFPCRISDSDNKDLMIMTLGDVQTPLADGVFDPLNDRITLKNGRVIDHYYRDTLRIAYYSPIDKAVFPLPPTGWCSWYYYYKEVNENDILRNAKWIAENLKDYGLQYIQIDDGWQGSGSTKGDNRDWTVVNSRFPSGLEKLAESIKYLGFKPGIWLAPHGQSSEAVVKNNPGVFLLKGDGTSASDTWEGRYLVDPSSEKAGEYLKNLFKTLCSWGFDYFKIDGQPVVVREYRSKKQFMKDSGGSADLRYRITLDSMRSVLGSGRYILGCWGIPLEGAGIMNGSRTGGDVLPAWSGFETALTATMQYYFLHNIVWYNDPDCLLLRYPLTPEEARAWATLQGLTGQALMVSERMSDLPEERVEILRRVAPALDIRPLDIFPSERRKKIWDLKVNHLNRKYDVVGVFNSDREKKQQVYLKWKKLGIAEVGPVHVFDFWNREYLGSWEMGIAIDVPPSGCRVLTLLNQTDKVQLISTSRHISQGWTDLEALSYNNNSISGRSRVIKNDPYELRFVFPRTMNYKVSEATAGNLPLKINSYQGWATVEFVSPETKEIDWEVSFSRSEYYYYPVQEVADLAILPAVPDGVRLRWSDQYYLSAGYQVYLDGKMLGYTPINTFYIDGLDPKASYTAEVATVWTDGTESNKRTGVKFTPVSFFPEAVSLSDLTPLKATAGWGVVEMNRSVTGNPLSIGGRKFESGIGTHARSVIEFRLNGLYKNFSALAGIDDGNNSQAGSVEFSVLGDGKELWHSSLVRKSDGAKEVNVDVENVQILSLRVSDGGDGIDFDHADWAKAVVSGLQK